MISIRTAIVEDLPTLLDFEQALIKAERPFEPTFKEGEIHYYDIKKMIEVDDVEVLVAEENEELIASGYARIMVSQPYFKFDKLAYLGFMYTRPTHRGKGVNKQIIESLFQWIKEKGIEEVRLDVFDDNIGAIKAYEKVGFKGHLLKMRMSL
ncbi:L-amino acid N-acyltransferase YncA [Tenacibaculum sp. MAR_2009_124]|uniref:GNAT family N-acetyltransferase n=1 Tax=Tenacibaculum sp. MAR_2009_124 TaxID=1250059 RepID=UPI000897DC4D|nr:GNAT family N-acetyltransferase [Tenacibaculum sp. MAR_2009_124]SEB39011.1 L-amino acid N-acyltransferase YncA [Tenacibaculum sp. MAR_2009_124]